MPEHQQTQQSKKSESSSQRSMIPANPIHISHPASIIQRARINPKSLTHADVMQLQRTIGNRAVGRLLSEIGLISSKSKQAPPVQRQEIPEPEEEEPPLQGKFENKPQQETCPSCSTLPIQRETENRTGMPDNLKAGVESLSGMDMSDVRVHYNSSKPAEVGALAYTQGTDIHVAPGQERHLPHEAWHVVQQAQGRVRPTMQLKEGVAVNDDSKLEMEADSTGERAEQMRVSAPLQRKINETIKKPKVSNTAAIQFFKDPPGTGEDVDIEELPAEKIEYYLKNAELYEITGDERTQLQERLESLKLAIGMMETGMSQSMISSTCQMGERLFTEFETAKQKLPGRKPRIKIKSGDRKQIMHSALARVGSLVLKHDVERFGAEHKQRSAEVVKARRGMCEGVRTTAGKLDEVATEVATTHPYDKELESKKSLGTTMLQQDTGKYEYEGFVTPYNQSFPVGAQDEFEFDHQPQNDIIEKAAELEVSEGKPIKKIAENHSQGGLTIVLHHSRHAAGGTYGKASEMKGILEGIDKSKDDDNETKIGKIKNVLIEATKQDADKMIAVYNDDNNYTDIDEILKKDPSQAAKLKGLIKTNVIAGEGKIKSQTFDNWFIDESK